MLLNKLTNKYVTKFANIKRFIGYPAVAIGNIFNIYFMRKDELNNGVILLDENHNSVNVSSVNAAYKALIETSITRVILPIPVFILSPTLMVLIEK